MRTKKTMMLVDPNKGGPCNLTNLKKIAGALGIKPADLFLTDREEVSYKTKLLIDRLAEALK